MRGHVGQRRNRRRDRVDLDVSVRAHPRLSQRIAGAVDDRAAVAGDLEVADVLPGRHRVDEGQGVAARARRIGRRRAIVQRQRRPGADGQSLARRQGERHGLAGGEVGAVRGHVGQRRNRRRDRVDLDVSVRAHPRLSQRIAGAVDDRAAVAGDLEVADVLPGRHRVDEGQGVAARARRIGRRRAIVQRQRRPGADGQSLARRQGERHGLAGGEVGAVRGHVGQRRNRRRDRIQRIRHRRAGSDVAVAVGHRSHQAVGALVGQGHVRRPRPVALHRRRGEDVAVVAQRHRPAPHHGRAAARNRARYRLAGLIGGFRSAGDLNLRRRGRRGANRHVRCDGAPPRGPVEAVGDPRLHIFVRDPESVGVVGIRDRGRIGSPAHQPGGVHWSNERNAAPLIKRGRTEILVRSRDHVIVGRIHGRAGRSEIDQDVARPVDSDGWIENGDVGTEPQRRGRNVSALNENRLGRIGDVELEPLEFRLRASRRQHFADAIDVVAAAERCECEARDFPAADVELQRSPRLRGGEIVAAAALVAIAETQGLRRAVLAGGDVVGLVFQLRLGAIGIRADQIRVAVAARHPVKVAVIQVLGRADARRRRSDRSAVDDTRQRNDKRVRAPADLRSDVDVGAVDRDARHVGRKRARHQSGDVPAVAGIGRGRDIDVDLAVVVDDGGENILAGCAVIGEARVQQRADGRLVRRVREQRVQAFRCRLIR